MIRDLAFILVVGMIVCGLGFVGLDRNPVPAPASALASTQKPVEPIQPEVTQQSGFIQRQPLPKGFGLAVLICAGFGMAIGGLICFLLWWLG